MGVPHANTKDAWMNAGALLLQGNFRKQRGLTQSPIQQWPVRHFKSCTGLESNELTAWFSKDCALTHFTFRRCSTIAFYYRSQPR